MERDGLADERVEVVVRRKGKRGTLCSRIFRRHDTVMLLFRVAHRYGVKTRYFDSDYKK